MKSFSLILFLAATLVLLVAGMCKPKNQDSSNNKIKNDTLPASIKGKVVFRIKNSEFFTNLKKKKINSVDEFRNYVPVFFYKKNGVFYIPNWLDNLIYKIDNSGKVIDKIFVPEETDIAHFTSTMPMTNMF